MTEPGITGLPQEASRRFGNNGSNTLLLLPYGKQKAQNRAL
jgi:hypothetical protein